MQQAKLIYPVASRKTHKGLDRRVSKHILVAELALGHKLPKGAIVHHIDETINFRNDNLVILENNEEHRALHRRLRVLRAGGNPWTQLRCNTCFVPQDIEVFHPSEQKSGVTTRCPECNRKRTAERKRKADAARNANPVS